MLKRVFALILVTVSTAWAQVAWTTLNIEKANVSFPQQPVVTESKETTLIGSIVTHNYEFKGERYSLVVNSAKLPRLAVRMEGSQGLFEEAAKALLKDNEGSEKIDMAQSKLGTHDAANLTFRYSTGMGRACFVLVDTVLYTTEACWEGNTPPPAVERFFSSLAFK